MKRLFVVGISLVVVTPLSAQNVGVALQGAAVRHVEVDESLASQGLGATALVRLHRGRVTVEALGTWASLDADDASRTDFSILHGDIRLRFAVHDALDIEAGAGRRAVAPRFAAQEFALFRVGVHSLAALHTDADVWVRGAYLLVPQFSGGGRAGFSAEIGFGAGVRLFGPLRGRVDFDFQRIDRTVAGAGVPIEVVGVRFGFERRW